MEFSQAIKRPFSNIKSWIIGCALSILPIVNFFAMGYTAEAAKLTLKKKNNLPEWNNWGSLFIQGLLIFVAMALYFIPALLSALIAGFSVLKGLLPAIISGQMDTAMLSGMISNLGSGLAFLGLAGLLFVAAWYIGPSAILAFISTGKFAEIFNFKKVFGKAFTGKYFVAWIVSIVVVLVLGLVLSWIPVIGSGISSFTGMMIMYTLLADAYR